jgi:hypothetical protein
MTAFGLFKVRRLLNRSPMPWGPLAPPQKLLIKMNVKGIMLIETVKIKMRNE